MARNKQRVGLDGGSGLTSNAFGSLDASGLPAAPLAPSAVGRTTTPPAGKPRNRGRLELRREKSGRGGKTVTVVSGFVGISNDEKVELSKSIQRRCGVGGSVKEGHIELQGDQREAAREILEAAGFRVVLAGG